MQESLAFVHGFSFSGKQGELCATRPEEVVPALRLLEERVAAGLHAAGFLSYEAAGALNGHLVTRAPGGFPLLWFGLYERRSPDPFPPASAPFDTSNWSASLGPDSFARCVGSIRELIAAGDCYQVNFTLRQRFSFAGCPRSFFHQIRLSQPTPFASYLETGPYRIVSASPELFFSLAGGVLSTKPMKGTAGRGRWAEEDEAQKRRLRESPKELAENLMIVDLLRNDMGMVSDTGSVRVTSLFDVETHPTVHQMTSTIESRLRAGVGTVELLQALFPCGSITGAPKRRSMEIIAQLEQEPRGVYTGCIGYLSPGEARFSVAIRTAVLDLERGTGEIGIGSGITYDSVAQDEYAECLAKGRFAREQLPEFHLIESLLFDQEGYFLLERHLERLARSAAYFGFPLQREAARRALEEVARDLAGRHKVRLLLFGDGRLHCEAAPIADAAAEATACFAKGTVASSNRFLYHKTSLRRLYSEEAAARPDVTEVLFLNERGEVTEGVNSNIVARVGGELLTPPLESGLLPGVLREELLAQGTIGERVLTRSDLDRAEEIYLVNSVRKWRRVRLVD